MEGNQKIIAQYSTAQYRTVHCSGDVAEIIRFLFKSSSESDHVQHNTLTTRYFRIPDESAQICN